jgi:hypothetical protein
LPSNTRGRSRIPEWGTFGSVQGGPVTDIPTVIFGHFRSFASVSYGRLNVGIAQTTDLRA